MSARSLLTSIAVATCAVICLPILGSASATELPDGRVYEMVSPSEGRSEVYEPDIPTTEYSVIKTQEPFQASVDGNGVMYIATAGSEGNENLEFDGGNQYLARRSSGGVWTRANISPPAVPSVMFEGFSSDLSTGFLDSVEPLSAIAPGWGELARPGGSYDVLYSTNTAQVGEYAPAFTVKPPYREPYTFQTSEIGHIAQSGLAGRGNERTLAYAGASADSTHVLFEANDALTAGAEGGAASNYGQENNLYESVGGQLRLVNVLPDGSTKANATFGAPNTESINGQYASPDFSHVISTDGSKVFWTDLSTGHIYVRENGTSTVEISPAGRYWTATADGAKVFYTNGELYEDEVESGHTIDLTPGVAVRGVIGASEDGKYVYYVTAGFDLDLWHDGETIKIKTLSASDNGEVEPYGNQLFAGDWQPGFGNRTAEVTPDGHGVVFMSTEGVSGIGDVDVYSADENKLYCASCGSEGSKGILSLAYGNTYQERWISEDGDRVFFDSAEALVAQDANGRLDAYEWERPGSGSCKSSTGCIYLLSGGTSRDESYVADASASGDDVFIITRARLSTNDSFENYDLYDARVNGERPIAAPACTGTGCQGVPGAPPIFATPSSVTFEGVGNFTAPSPVMPAKHESKPKKKSKPKKRHKKPKRKYATKGSKSGRLASDVRASMRNSRKGGRR
jgi:hypothetical protein